MANKVLLSFAQTIYPYRNTYPVPLTKWRIRYRLPSHLREYFVLIKIIKLQRKIKWALFGGFFVKSSEHNQ